MAGASSRNIGGRLALALVLLLTAAPAPRAAVDPAQYHAFWLWNAAGARPYLDRAATLYVLQGEIAAGRDGVARLMRQGIAALALPGPEVYLVYRLRTLDWGSGIVAGLRNDIAAWQHAGSRIAGIQLDFDARTLGLADYAAFLKRVRGELPQPYRLSVTGLLDWSTGGAPEAFAAMAGTVDEIVFQAYRGRQTIPGYRDYLTAVARLRLPFRIGLVEGGAWEPADEERLAASPFFRGAVVFLLRQR
jgi:hypothetical protein